MGDNYLEQRQILKVPCSKRTAAARWEEGPPPKDWRLWERSAGRRFPTQGQSVLT